MAFGAKISELIQIVRPPTTAKRPPKELALGQAIAIYFNLPLSLGISSLNITLMYLTFFIGALTLAIGRTTLLQGVVHLIIFFEYLFLSLVP